MAQEYKKILVAVDGSLASEKAFKKAVGVAKRNNAELVIAHVLDLNKTGAIEAYNNLITEQAIKFAEQLLSDYKDEALQDGLAYVTTVLEYGSPKTIIPKQIAPENKIDLIMCGATGLSAVERFFIGSVSENIARHSSCDVLIVRNEDENEDK
ncbi:MAG: universal stress protein [Bacillaceae bacterium]